MDSIYFFDALSAPETGAGEEAMRNVVIINAVARLVVDSIVNRAVVAAVTVAQALCRYMHSRHLGHPMPSYLLLTSGKRSSTCQWEPTRQEQPFTTLAIGGRGFSGGSGSSR